MISARESLSKKEEARTQANVYGEASSGCSTSTDEWNEWKLNFLFTHFSHFFLPLSMYRWTDENIIIRLR